MREVYHEVRLGVTTRISLNIVKYLTFDCELEYIIKVKVIFCLRLCLYEKTPNLHFVVHSWDVSVAVLIGSFEDERNWINTWKWKG